MPKYAVKVSEPWSIWTGAAACLPLVGVVTRLVYLVQGREDALLRATRDGGETAPVIVIGVALLSIVFVVTALWLSFFPPARYLNWVRGRQLEAQVA